MQNGTVIIHWEGERLNKTELVKSNLQASELGTALCLLDIQISLFFRMLLHKVLIENGGTGVAQCNDKFTSWSTEIWVPFPAWTRDVSLRYV
jgi:hypothetical protein